MTRTPLRLTLPAQPRTSREQLRIVLPRTLWGLLPQPAQGVEPAGPLLLAFHGTGFMQALFAWLAGEGPLPPQRAWRDWCEPPAAMLARAGQEAYPPSVRRGTPWGLPADQAVPTASPAWLRKLYLPQHDRFTVVVLELICLAAGWPPLDRGRVREAGLLVRRLRRGDPAGGEQWEDWIASDPRQGRWVAPPATWEADPGRDPADRPGLASQPLALAPTTLAGMGKRCVLHGYLSTTSAEQESPADPQPVETRTAAATALRQRTEAALVDLAAAAPPSAWRPPALPLRELLQDTLLSPPPSAAVLTGARTALQAVITADLLDRALEHSLRVLIGFGLDSSRLATDLSGNVISGADLWGQGASSVVSEGLTALRSSGGTGLIVGADSDWDVLVRDRLEQGLTAWISGQPLPDAAAARWMRLRDRLLPALVAAALVRARGCRLALAQWMNQAQGIVQNLQDRDATRPRARHSLADLAEGLESFLASEDERRARDGLVPWGAAPAPAAEDRLRRVDRNLRTLTAHYAPLEAQLAAAGAQVAFVLRQRADDLERDIGLALNELRAELGQAAVTPGLPSLLERGVDLLEPPANGLLLLPGLEDPAANRLSAISAGIMMRYPAPGGPAPPAPAAASGTEALVGGVLRRPRFDAHHLYAVQAWVRVAGRVPGEAERVIWSLRSEPFVLAEPTDLLGSQPQAVPLPDLPRLLRDLARVRKAGANPFLTLVPPPRSGADSSGGGLEGLHRDWGMGTPVALVAPVLAVVGLGLLSSALRTLSLVPGLAWLRQVVIRTPAPERRP